MAQVANYSAERQIVDGVEVVRLSDAAHRMDVSIAPSIGNIAYDLRVNGQPILMPPSARLPDWKAKPAQAGIPFLAPWANRMDPDAFWANGKKYLLNPNAADLRRDSNGLAIHGLLLFASDWQVLSVHADANAAEVVSRLEFWRHPEWMAQFPFAHSIEMTQRLSNGVLEVRTAIHNESRDPMPLLIGFHPWYQIPGAPRDRWTVHMPVSDHYTLTDKLVPTGERKPAHLPDPLPLARHQFDDVFGGVNSNDEFWLEEGGRRISVRFGPKFPVAVVYAPSTRNVVCFEPMTAITNGFNLAHAGLYKELQSVAPGQTWTESFWIRPSGF
ncbi:MAG TPA: aldose 1-epimerase [Bryobacteraceae bacterium]|nr:aldose 1-epimerase [Bryobacteraceae bacterium]